MPDHPADERSPGIRGREWRQNRLRGLTVAWSPEGGPHRRLLPRVRVVNHSG